MSWNLACSRRSELEKGDLRDFLFETIAPYLPSKMHYVYKKKRGTYEMIPFGKNKRWPRAMKAPLRKVKCETSVAFFFFLHAYSTSNLRTFCRTCVHVRKECSLEISVNKTPLLRGVRKEVLRGGSPNPAGGLGGGAVSPPAGSGAEPRKFLKLTLFRG